MSVPIRKARESRSALEECEPQRRRKGKRNAPRGVAASVSPFSDAAMLLPPSVSFKHQNRTAPLSRCQKSLESTSN
ncbi:hypothetical protein MA16_Dca007953 [Dendrobium catenatum]|uniref:Uncharacterized protein n=1 Tax=Dendrobium catenatum TaxID=906689 RepID=A0A2I0XJD1_9ASPA|nr:hypothetical protein MA16_Dca007953 [Dendrobium catenatum]